MLLDFKKMQYSNAGQKPQGKVSKKPVYGYQEANPIEISVTYF